MAEKNGGELTPLMAQYRQIKDLYKNEVLFFRVGDFYEMFGEDAVKISRLLNITLTSRGGVAMCGVPCHASKVYIARLLRLGKKVAIAEQIGEVSKGRGITERKVVEVVTPGTAIESEYLDGTVNNFLASFCFSFGMAAFAYIDVTTGDFFAESWAQNEISERLPKELERCKVRELLLPESFRQNNIVQNAISSQNELSVSYFPDWNFDSSVSYPRLLRQFEVQNLKSFSLTEKSPEVAPAGFLLDYLSQTISTKFSHITSIKIFDDSDYLLIDEASMRNLEILGNLRDDGFQFSLLECVNHTKTAMGNRLLRTWLTTPLVNAKKINARLEKVSVFYDDFDFLNESGEILGAILDIERLATRIALEKAHPKDLCALKFSLQAWLNLKNVISKKGFSTFQEEISQKCIDLIEKSILENPSTIITDGGIIKSGYCENLDHLRALQSDSDKFLREYLMEEREKSGIQNLRIGNNNMSGYFLEVTRGNSKKVPQHFLLKRALVNVERYTTEKLQKLESDLISAATQILETERDLFLEIRRKLAKNVPFFLQIAKEIAEIDVFYSFASASRLHKWVRPQILSNEDFFVTNGRHPVVELHLPQGEFVPNDAYLSSKENSPLFALITGPNMAGKSTYLRQNALIAILAQTGCFVPAESAKIGIVDKIFCRVGASDNLARGESTFLVEMTETARILRSATKKSLVIMDEVGRGTSTEDGLSIAWAVSEYLLDFIKCRTFFATHYHQLTQLENPRLKLLCMDIKEIPATEKSNAKIIFLRKIKAGIGKNSYGIHVASLAGVPQSVINRATQIFSSIQNTNQNIKDQNLIPPKNEAQPIFFAPKEAQSKLFSDEELIINEILSSDENNLTPLEALQLLIKWKNFLNGK